jgi:phosphatidylglycerophosphate synthase
MNIPNVISTFRIVAAPVMWLLMYFDQKDAFTWLLTAAFFSDSIDGYIARKLNQVTKLGSVLDSYGDSLTIISGIAGLIKFRYDLFREFDTILYVVVAVHVTQLLLALWRYGKPSSFHTWSAKAAAIAIGIFILFTLHFYFVPWLFYLTVVLLLIDGIEESILVMLEKTWKTDIKGVWWRKKKSGISDI